jgi:trimeric autotransporter adhesin
VAVTATSVADPSRSAVASVEVVCSQTGSISPASSHVAFLQTELLTATLCLAPGAAIQWDVNGVVGGNSLLGTVTSSGAATAIYTAPASLPPSNPVTVHAVSGSTSASATINIYTGIAVTISPDSAVVNTGQGLLLAATVAGTANQGITWAVNGITNGIAALGQICMVGSNPCSTPSGPVAGAVEFLAPAMVPAASPVEVTAIPAADPSAYSDAVLTIVNPSGVSVTISPAYAFVVPTTTAPSDYPFTAQVTGATNTAVTWTLSSTVAGATCTAATCGSFTASGTAPGATGISSGVYTAPGAAPSPNAFALTATSVSDPTASATSVLTITSGPSIEQILPSSVMAGVASSFTLALNGLGFVSTTPGVSPVILVNGSARDSACLSPLNCTTTIDPSDVATAGSVSVQVQIPGAAASLSNPVNLVVVPFDESQQTINLSADSPDYTANIVVYEPTSAAVTTAQINVDSAGTLIAGTCTLQGKAIPVTPPASGSEIFSICVHGNTLDPSFTYQFSGPSPSDIAVTASSLANLFPNLIELDLTITSSTLPGVRTLFITTPNNDRAAASGVLEVQ